MRGAWIEIAIRLLYILPLRSLPMRGAWIEILQMMYIGIMNGVAPHAGGVD